MRLVLICGGGCICTVPKQYGWIPRAKYVKHSYIHKTFCTQYSYFVMVPRIKSRCLTSGKSIASKIHAYTFFNMFRAGLKSIPTCMLDFPDIPRV